MTTNFHQLGWGGLVVAMSVLMYPSCPLSMRFFSRLLIGPEITLPVQDLSLVNFPPPSRSRPPSIYFFLCDAAGIFNWYQFFYLQRSWELVTPVGGIFIKSINDCLNIYDVIPLFMSFYMRLLLMCFLRVISFLTM